MLTVIACSLLPALAAERPSSPPVERARAASAPAPAPVEAYTRRDLRADRLASIGLVTTLISPGFIAVGAGLFDTEFAFGDVGTGLDDVLLGVGAFGALTGPPGLLHFSGRSARALRRQGLDVRRRAVHVGTALYVAALGVNLLSAAIQPLDDATLGVTALGLYGASVGCGALQLATNHRARRRAGWLGVIPSPAREHLGVTVAGTF